METILVKKVIVIGTREIECAGYDATSDIEEAIARGHLPKNPTDAQIVGFLQD